MKKYPFALVLIFFAFFSSSCSENKSIKSESESVSAKKTSNASKEEDKVLNTSETKEMEADTKSMNYPEICEEKQEKNPDSEDPTLIKTCTFRNYKTVLTGSADYKGRYSWEYSLYKKTKDKEVKIENTALFNQKQSDLLEKINQKIKADYLALAGDPEHKECFEGQQDFNSFQMNDLGIQFEGDKILFHAEYGLPGACMAVGGTTVSFTLKEAEPYFNE